MLPTCKAAPEYDVRVRSAPRFVFALGFALACTDDVIVADEVGDDEETSDTSSSSEDSTDTTTSDTSGTETETGEPEPYCGDGNLDELYEECDDGNAIDDDGCNNACESACGTRGWLDLTIDEGWFDIQLMARRPGNELAALGDVEIEGKAGRLRMVTVADDQVLGALESDPLGSMGTPALPQTHRIDAIARTPMGESIVLLGTSTEVLVVDEDPVVRYWIAHFDGESLAEQWRVEFPVTDPDLRPVGLAVLEGGDAIVSMTVEVAQNDRDLGFERRSIADGSVVWTSSFSGELNGGWSLDTAGHVAVGAGDRVWATGIVRVDWQTFETNLVELDPESGAVLWSDAPLPDPGNVHEQRLGSLAAGPGGTVAVGIDVLGPSSSTNYGAAYGYVEHELVWELLPEDLPWEDGGPFLEPKVAVDDDGEVLVVGRYTHDFGLNTAARPWVIAMTPEGTMLCAARIGEGNNAALVPEIGFFGGGRGAVNLDTYGPGGMGPMSAGNWIAGLRGW
jgi:cysteine-rich repeat protein